MEHGALKKEVRQDIKDLVKEEIEILKKKTDDVHNEDEFEGIIKHFLTFLFFLEKGAVLKGFLDRKLIVEML